jgi:hypothetical protein
VARVLGGERLPVNGYQVTVSTNIITNKTGNRSRTEGILVNRVARANLADSNLASNHNSNRQNCGGPRLGGERLPVYLYQLTVTTNIITNKTGSRSRTEGILVNRVARANLANSNLASNHNSNRQNCGGPRLAEGDDDFPYGDKSGRVFIEQHSFLHSKSSTFSELR